MRAFVGVGPGRCGTKSLQEFVDGCKNTKVTHERFHSRWYAHDQPIRDLAAEMLAMDKDGVLCGEVQCQILSHVPYLRTLVPGLKVICLHRPKEEVVQSYMNGFKPMFRPVDKHANYPPGSVWPGRYPIIDAATPEQAYAFWWEMCEDLMYSMHSVHHVECNHLSDDNTIKSIFDHLEIPEVDRVMPKNRVWNTSEERSNMTLREHMIAAGQL